MLKRLAPLAIAGTVGFLLASLLSGGTPANAASTTTTDKAIATLKSQMNILQQRVEALETAGETVSSSNSDQVKLINYTACINDPSDAYNLGTYIIGVCAAKYLQQLQ